MSYAYPLVEVLSVISLLAIVAIVPTRYWPAYFIFFSALLITIYTDARFMLISRFVTVYLLPLPIMLSLVGLLPISPTASMLGALSGYAVLATVGWLFKVTMKKQGIGQGDIDVLSFIGAFLGFGGWWISLLIGSLTGSIAGIAYIALTRQGKNCKIPFGPFLAFGAMLYTLWGQQILALFFPHLP